MNYIVQMYHKSDSTYQWFGPMPKAELMQKIWYLQTVVGQWEVDAIYKLDIVDSDEFLKKIN